MADQKSTRGFASMERDRVREIARKGGSNTPDEKRTFSTNRQLTSDAGRKGGDRSGDAFGAVHVRASRDGGVRYRRVRACSSAEGHAMQAKTPAIGHEPAMPSRSA